MAPRRQSDLLTQLMRELRDRTVPVSDVLRTCLFLAGSTEAARLEAWATAELDGYQGFDVPDYRKIRAPVMQILESPFIGGQLTEPLNVHSLPEIARETIGELVPLNQSVDDLEALAGQAEAQRKPVQLSVLGGDVYANWWNTSNAGRSYNIVALYWAVDATLIRGVLGRIHTALTKFVVKLLAEVGDDELPSAERTENALRAAVGPAVLNNPIFNVFTDQSQAGGVVAGQPHHEYNFGGVKGNVAAGSSNVSQVYNDTFDLARVRDFADLVTEIIGTLELEPGQREALSAGASELHAAIDDPAADRGRMRRALDAIMNPLKLAGATAVRNAAITLGTQVGDSLDAAIRHLPH